MATSTELLDLATGVGQRADAFRFDVLTASLSRTGSIEMRADFVPMVANNIHATIKRTLTVGPKPGEIDQLDPLTARIRPVMTVGGTEYNLGVFMFADASHVRWSYGTVPDATMVDQSLIVDQALPNSYGAAVGTSVKTLIEDLLAATGINVFDIGVDATVSSPMAWPPGTSRMQVINQLAATAGGYSLFFNNDGCACVIEAPDIDSPTATYTSTSPRVLIGSIIESNDALDAPNQFIVISQTGDGSSGSAVGVYDVPDAADHSAASRGFVVAKVLPVTGLTTDTAAAARAKAWGKQSASNYEWVSFGSHLDPRHDTFDVVSFNVGSGAVVYREQGWTMALEPGGMMTHDLRRSYDA